MFFQRDGRAKKWPPRGRRRLGSEDLTQFVADVLKRTPEAAQPLAQLVHRKTNGNPFFVIQFLKSLYSEDLLTFDYEQGGWQVDLARIQNLDITDNVVDLMVRKIQRLSEATQGGVKLAACIGNTFDLYTLAIVSESTPEQAAAGLEEALREGLLVPASDLGARVMELKASCGVDQAREALFKFLHDRVQQAAYSLIPDADKTVVHGQVGRLLLQHSTEETLEERLFDIVGHLNTGATLITDQEERTHLADLNLRAGRKAKTSTAYQPALNYFTEGTVHLPADAWKTNYDLAFALHLERAECEYLCGHFEKAEQELDRLLEWATSPLEQAESYRIRIVQYENTSRFPEARDWGKQGLALFGIVFPEDDAERQASLDAEMRAINEKIGARDIEDLVDLPVMTDEAMRMSMKLLMTMWAPSYISGDMMLTVLIATKMVNLSLTYGNVEESAYGYITYAIEVGPRRGDFASAYAFGRLALKVNETFDDLTARAKVNHMFSCYISFWRKHIASCFPHSREAYRAGLESGDFLYAAYGVFHESWHALFSGQALNEFHHHYSAYLAFMTKTKNQTFLDTHQLILHWSRAIQGRTEEPCSLTSDDFDEAFYLKTYESLAFFVSFYYVIKLHVLYLFGDFDTPRSKERGFLFHRPPR